MFTDESLDVIGVQSSWKKSQRQHQYSKTCQTVPVHTVVAETQIKNKVSNSSQTDPPENLADQLMLHLDLSAELPGLREFLHCVEDMVIQELVKNSKSHAFDGVNCSDQQETVSCIFRLGYCEAQNRGLQVTSVSWNCTGSVIACAFGSVDDDDWSTERSYVCTWNLYRRRVNPKQPDMVIETSTPVMCVSFHPLRPSLIAGGLYSGEVMLWDMSRIQDTVLANTGMCSDTHKEPVYEVKWVPGPRCGEMEVVSACSAGRVLRWSVDEVEGKLTLTAGFALVRQQLPLSPSASRVRGNTAVGVTSLSLSPWDTDMFLVGTEGGLVLKCSFSSQTVAAVPPDGESVTLHAPAQFSFSTQAGPVQSLHFSPFHRNLFVSVGTDGLAHVHSVLQPGPLLSLRVSDSFVFGVRWSPIRSLVFVAVTGQGVLQVFDLDEKSVRPVITIEQDTESQRALCVEFNKQQLLAVGNADGTVKIWQLSAELIEQHTKESAVLQQLADDVSD